MKYLSSILLIIFMIFQFSSSITYLVENSSTTSISIFDQDEDEENSEKSDNSKDCKVEFVLPSINISKLIPSQESAKIAYFYLHTHYSVATTVALLPPQQV